MTDERNLFAMFRIKICGIVHKEDIFASVDAGADALGFLLGMAHKAEDSLALSEAVELIHAVPGHIWSVLVTHLTDPSSIIPYARLTKCRALQIQEDISVSDLAGIRTTLPGLSVIKALLVEDKPIEDVYRSAAELAPHVDAFVCDSVDRADDRIGGTGRIHDWSLSRKLVTRLDRPVLLAGGLNPLNVRKAVRSVCPWGVDVNSGVESPPRGGSGRKDGQKLRLFAAGARRALGLSDDF
jgi:phosphoribosylanthranilate isomerase